MTSQTAQPIPQAPPGHPALLFITYPPRRKPLIILPRMIWGLIAVIPQGIILYFYNILAVVVMIFAFFVILITGSYPKGMFDFVVGNFRWQWRVQSYITLLTDKYPPFTGRG
jgi:hypothetical protein